MENQKVSATRERERAEKEALKKSVGAVGSKRYTRDRDGIWFEGMGNIEIGGK